MKKERVIFVSILGGIAVIVASVAISNLLSSMAEAPRRGGNRPARGVVVSAASPEAVPYQVEVYGQARAFNRVEMFAEVSGVLQRTQPPFLEGESFRAGQTLFRMEDSEARASLMSQRSNYINTLTQVLPDLKIDYPDMYSEWEEYLLGLDVNRTTPSYPEITESKARIFLTSRGVISAYHNLKSAEERLSKYHLEAPFNGVVTQSSIRPGTLVRVGQPLGTFIDPNSFEIEVSVSANELSYIEIGDTVHLHSPDFEGEVVAQIKRINSQIDASTQSVKVFLNVDRETSEFPIQEGMYLSGIIKGENLENVVRVPRRLITAEGENSSLWVVSQSDSTTMRREVQVKGYIDDDALVTGLNNGQWYIAQVAPGLLAGEKVNVSLSEQ